MANINVNAPSSAGGSHMIFSLGYVADGQKALLELQKDLMELQETQRKMNIAFLDMQKAAMNASALATQNSANADAKAAVFEAWDHGSQAITTAVNAAYTGVKTVGLKGQLEEPRTNLNNANKFDEEFNKAPVAARGIGDGDLPELNEQQRLRYNDIRDGRGGEFEAGDEKILSNLKRNEADRTNFTKQLESHKERATREENTITTNHQSTIQHFQMYTQIAQQATSTGLSYGKSDVAEHQKGPADAMKGLAQSAEQASQSALGQGMEQANGYESYANQINRAREALAGNGQG